LYAFTQRIDEAEKLIDQAEELLTQEVLRKLEKHIVRRLQGLMESVRAEICGARGQREETLAAFDRANKLLNQDFTSEYYYVETMCRYIETLIQYSAIDWFSGEAELQVAATDLAEKALAQAERLVKRFPYSVSPRQTILAPYITFGREADALKEISWLIDNAEILELDSFANLILIASGSSTAKQEARELVRQWKAKIAAEVYVGYKREVLDKLKATNRFEPDAELKEILG